MKIIQKQTLQQWIPIEEFLEEGILKLKNKKYIKIIKVDPINYNLKSDLEKKSILNSYKTFLKTCNFDIQILIQSNKENLSNHINILEKNIQKKENKYLNELYKNYLNYIKEINLSKKSSSKDFYIIISNEKNLKIENENSFEIIKNELKEKYFKIKECLSRCGNSVIEIETKKELINILFSFLNSRIYLNNIN